MPDGRSLRKKKSYASTSLTPNPDYPDVNYRKKVYKCACCGIEKNRANGIFPKTKSPLFTSNDGYAPFCWGCINKYYERMVNFFKGDEVRACDYVCSLLDIYFNKNSFDELPVGELSERMKAYVTKINRAQLGERTYLDTLTDRNASSILSDVDVNANDIDIETVRKWGYGFDSEQYRVLESEYADWEARCVIESKSREKLVRDLCVIILMQQIAIKDGNIDKYKTLTELYQKTLDRAELTPKIAVSRDKDNEKPIGVMIKMFEEERPISEPLPEWKDVDGIMKLVLVYFIGHLSKMLNLNNRYSKMYEEEMDKYRVFVPEIGDSDTEEVFDYLLTNGGIELGGASSDEHNK